MKLCRPGGDLCPSCHKSPSWPQNQRMESQNGLGWKEPKGSPGSNPPRSQNIEIVSEPCFPRSALRTDTLKGRTGPGSVSPGCSGSALKEQRKSSVFFSAWGEVNLGWVFFWEHLQCLQNHFLPIPSEDQSLISRAVSADFSTVHELKSTKKKLLSDCETALSLG